MVTLICYDRAEGPCHRPDAVYEPGRHPGQRGHSALPDRPALCGYLLGTQAARVSKGRELRGLMGGMGQRSHHLESAGQLSLPIQSHPLRRQPRSLSEVVYRQNFLAGAKMHTIKRLADVKSASA